MLVISKFLFCSIIMVWLSPLAQRWANVSKFPQICGTAPTFRQHFANRNKTFEHQLHLPFFNNNISDFEIVHFFLLSWSEFCGWPNVGPTFESLKKSGPLRQRFANRNKKFHDFSKLFKCRPTCFGNFKFFIFSIIKCRRWPNVWKFKELWGATPTFRQPK